MMKAHILIIILAICIPLGVCSKGMPDERKDRKDMNGYVFRDTASAECSFNRFKGECVFVEVWSMSCRNCLLEMPHFQKLAEAYAGKGIQFVSICVDNNLPLWKDFLKRKHIEGIQWNTPIFSPFLKENGLMALPGFVLMDRAGRLVWKNRLRPSDPSIRKELDRILEEKA